ncbi:MAG: hypothetical protein LBB48_00595 [Treponema sp.]|nr:hypothetical protein [Treponema sp.]
MKKNRFLVLGILALALIFGMYWLVAAMTTMIKAAATTPTADKTLGAGVNLFDTLYIIDNSKASAIHAHKSPDSGLCSAINHRLTRAAAKRL